MLASEVWETLVRVTQASNNECIRSIRIPLYVSLQKSLRPSLARQAWRLLVGTRMFHSNHSLHLPSVTRGRTVFCFAHATPSNVQNLLPIAREANRGALLGGIIAEPGGLEV